MTNGNYFLQSLALKKKKEEKRRTSLGRELIDRLLLKNSQRSWSNSGTDKQLIKASREVCT